MALPEVPQPGAISHIGLGESPGPGDSRFEKSVKVFVRGGQRTAEWLEQQPRKPSHVIIYGGTAQYMFYVGRWCVRNQVPLIVDVVEWYSPKQLMGGYFGPLHVGAKFALKYQYPRAAGIIAISSFLESYYLDRGSRVLRVPPTLDVRNLELAERTGDDRKLKLVYAGTPGNKDLLASAMSGVEHVDPEGKNIELRVVGPTSEQVRELLAGNNIPRAVKVFGRVAQPDVSAILQDSDFSILLREPKRFAQAGFPTKFCESLANGTPVIANITSDIGMYLRDGREGLVCPDHSVTSFTSTLTHALSLTRDRREEMRTAARKVALDSFDFRNHAEPIQRFFEAS